jgi:AcrR family transcriptional regulator
MGTSFSTTQKPNRERLTGAQRRAAIIEAAIDLFASRGFRGTTTREIAAAVGVTEPVLYQHFETKRGLYDAILESMVREPAARDIKAIEEAGETIEIRDFFTRIAGVLIDWYLEDPRFARLLMFAALEQNELSQMSYEQKVVGLYRLITGYLDQQMNSGRLRRMDSLLAARAFIGMVSHQGIIFSIYKPGELHGGRDVIVSTIVDIFLQGIESRTHE